MSIIIKDLKTLKIVSRYGYRVRNGKQEFHPGVDIRVVDEKWKIHDIIAPEEIEITTIEMSPRWGHAIYAKPTTKSKIEVDEFRFWHTVPIVKVGDILAAGDIIGIPESGYVDLHLHFEVRSKGKTIDPAVWFKFVNQETS